MKSGAIALYSVVAMDPDVNEPETLPRSPFADRGLRRHCLAYLIAISAAIVLDVTTANTWSAWWIVVGWGVVLGLHYLYVKAFRSDTRWADRRTRRLRRSSYDLGHISLIEKSYKEGDMPGRHDIDHRRVDE